MMKRVILASNSPRRKELLRQIGLVFTADPADVDERVIPGEAPDAYALRVAREKANVASRKAGGGIIIAADTIVVLNNAILGKPSDALEAERMLSMLSGREHRVITGLVVMDSETGKTVSRTETTRVWFRDLTEEDIRSYAASGEPLDKAGAYGIQEKGAILVRKIEGCYYNVVGLPLSLLAEMLDDFDLRLLKSSSI